MAETQSAQPGNRSVWQRIAMRVEANGLFQGRRGGCRNRRLQGEGKAQRSEEERGGETQQVLGRGVRHDRLLGGLKIAGPAPALPGFGSAYSAQDGAARELRSSRP